MPTTAIYIPDRRRRDAIEAVERLAASHGLSAIAYDDTNALRRRPALARLLEDARAGRLEAVCVASLQHLGCHFACAAVIQDLTALGVRVLSVEEPWLDVDAASRGLLATFMAWAAATEKARVTAKARTGLAQARRSGKRVGRPPLSLDLLEAAARDLASGMSQRGAAHKNGISDPAFRAYLKKVGARAQMKGAEAANAFDHVQMMG